MIKESKIGYPIFDPKNRMELGHLISITVIVTAVYLRLWPSGALELHIPWIIFYPVVMVAAFYWGFTSGMLGTSLSVLSVLFWSQTGHLFIDDPGNWHGMAVFGVNATLISLIGGAMHRANASAIYTTEQAWRNMTGTHVAVERDKVVDHWNRTSCAYDGLKGCNSYYYAKLKELCSEKLGDTSFMSVMEIGCGTGDLLAHLNPAFGMGIDISEGMITRAKKKYTGSATLNFGVSEAENLEQVGRRFDAVMMCDVLEHVSDVKASISESSSVLEKGGLYFASTSSPIWAFPLWLGEKLGLKMEEGPHKWVSLRVMEQELVNNGFQILDSGYMTLVPMDIPLISSFFNNFIMRMPFIKQLGLTQFVLGRKRENA